MQNFHYYYLVPIYNKTLLHRVCILEPPRHTLCLTCFVIPEHSSHDHHHHCLRHPLCGP